MKLLKKEINNLTKLKKIFFEVKKRKYNKRVKIYESLDSIEILEFISKIEKVFKIKLSSNNINEKNFYSLETINNLIIDEK